jgi:hypothetical protein
MPSEAPYRLSVTEYLDSADALAAAADALGITVSEVGVLLESANQRLMRQLNLATPPIKVHSAGLRVEDIAGLVRVSQRFELEVAPKFLARDSPTWRGDFFVVATLSNHGRVLPQDRLIAGFGERGDLATLVGRAIVEMYWTNARRPLRTYRRTTWRDFSIDGDVEPEELVSPDPEGYLQAVTVFDRSNPYNQVIRAASERLLLEIRDTETRQQLLRVYERLSPQAMLQTRPSAVRVPSRHRRWQPLYELSCQVLDGFGVELADALHRMSPGYVLKTAKGWEHLVTAALRHGLPSGAVHVQQPHELGTRNSTVFMTTPDMTLHLAQPPVLADAKYKGRAGKEAMQVTAADVYEGLAFMRAAGAMKLILLYPRRDRPSENQPPTVLGSATLFETIKVEDLEIVGMEVECRGLSAKDGFQSFSRNLALAVEAA